MNKPPSLNLSKKRNQSKLLQPFTSPRTPQLLQPPFPINRNPGVIQPKPMTQSAPPLQSILPFKNCFFYPLPLIEIQGHGCDHLSLMSALMLWAVVVTPRSRKKGKSRAAGVSPRNMRRARRRLEKETVREEREVVPFAEEGVRARRKRTSKAGVRSEERLALVAWAPSLSPSPRICEEEITNVENCRDGGWPWELIVELVMWQNTAKSLLWFGLGMMLFFSSCFSKDVSFSMTSAFSHLGLLILGLAFLYDSIPERHQQKLKGTNFKLKEEDILRVAQLILPMVNAALAKSQEFFSGEPLMTLKVAPILVFHGKIWSPDNTMETFSHWYS